MGIAKCGSSSCDEASTLNVNMGLIVFKAAQSLVFLFKSIFVSAKNRAAHGAPDTTESIKIAYLFFEYKALVRNNAVNTKKGSREGKILFINISYPFRAAKAASLLNKISRIHMMAQKINLKFFMLDYTIIKGIV